MRIAKGEGCGKGCGDGSQITEITEIRFTSSESYRREIKTRGSERKFNKFELIGR